MTTLVLVDTDVLIRHLRAYAQATRRLDELGALTLSAVSYLEVLQDKAQDVTRDPLVGHARDRADVVDHAVDRDVVGLADVLGQPAFVVAEGSRVARSVGDDGHRAVWVEVVDPCGLSKFLHHVLR